MLYIDRFTDLFDIRDYLDKKIGQKESDEIYDFMERRKRSYHLPYQGECFVYVERSILYGEKRTIRKTASLFEGKLP